MQLSKELDRSHGFVTCGSVLFVASLSEKGGIIMKAIVWTKYGPLDVLKLEAVKFVKNTAFSLIKTYCGKNL